MPRVSTIAAAVAEHLAAELRLAPRPDPALARHLVRFDACPTGSSTARCLNTSILATSTAHRFADGPVLGLGRRRLLRRHLHARLALRPRRGPAVSRTGTRSPQADRFRHGTGPADRRDQPSRRRGRAGGRRPGRLHPPRLSRAPDVATTPRCSRNFGRGSSWPCSA